MIMANNFLTMIYCCPKCQILYPAAKVDEGEEPDAMTCIECNGLASLREFRFNQPLETQIFLFRPENERQLAAQAQWECTFYGITNEEFIAKSCLAKEEWVNDGGLLIAPAQEVLDMWRTL